MKYPEISIIIIGKTTEACSQAFQAMNESLEEPLEILCATGNNPSLQRNLAAQNAKGNYLLFLDNDSLVDERLLHYYSDAIKYYNAPDVIGGPSVYFDKSDTFRYAVQLTLTSVFALGPSKSRYTPLGEFRKSSEKELILCNLCIKKETFLKNGGFNINLYPNEENEFLNRISSSSIYYHPLALIKRKPRHSLWAFIKQMFNYGQGRAKHFVLNFTFFELIYTVPSFFTLYILLGLLLPFIFQNSFIPLYYLPLVLYLFLSASAGFLNGFFEKKRSAFISIFLFFACHFFYGLGFLLFFVKKEKREITFNCKLYQVKLDKEKKDVALVLLE